MGASCWSCSAGSVFGFNKILQLMGPPASCIFVFLIFVDVFFGKAHCHSRRCIPRLASCTTYVLQQMQQSYESIANERLYTLQHYVYCASDKMFLHSHAFCLRANVFSPTRLFSIGSPQCYFFRNIIAGRWTSCCWTHDIP